MNPSTVMATAAPLGSRLLRSQRTTGSSSPARSAATITGMIRKLIRLSSQIKAPPTTRMSPIRHAHDGRNADPVRDVLVKFAVRQHAGPDGAFQQAGPGPVPVAGVEWMGGVLGWRHSLILPQARPYGKRLPGIAQTMASIPQVMVNVSPGASQRSPSPELKALAGPVMGSIATALDLPGNGSVTKTWT